MRGSIRKVLAQIQRVTPAATGGTVVLAYHLVGGNTDSPVDLPRDVFRRQMQLLKTTHEVVSLATAVQLPEPQRLPLAVLTFDDAYLNFRSTVWPILREFELPATLYVPVGFVDARAPSPIRGVKLPACTWTDLRALAADGVHIGSHSVSHRNMVKLRPEEVEFELKDSRAQLQDMLGVPVTSFCYPQAKWRRSMLAAVGRHYDTAVVAGGTRYHTNRTSRHCIPRFPVRRDDPDFARLLASRIWLSEAAANTVRQWVP